MRAPEGRKASPGWADGAGSGGCAIWSKNSRVRVVKGLQCWNRVLGLDSLGWRRRLWVGAQGKDLAASFFTQGPAQRRPPTNMC